MTLQKDISEAENRGQIIITDDTINSDGSVTINYSLNHKALEECAAYYETDIDKLTHDEIHTFAARNIGNALNCHKGWKLVNKS
jgi:hypothetical protein